MLADTLKSSLRLATRSGRSHNLAKELQEFLSKTMIEFPWEVIVTDWMGRTYELGKKEPHFSGRPLRVHLHTDAAGRDLMSLDGMSFLERFLSGEVDLSGNLYALSAIRKYSKLHLKPWHLLDRAMNTVAFQDMGRASVSVKSHYDIPQEALNVYLDQVYMSYSCGMYEHPERIELDELLGVGKGQEDDFDSLEKSMWRKFKDAADYIAPAEGESLLDIGCGYGGQLAVALENHPFGRVVGWTHSHNQALEGRKMLSQFDADRWELREGDYREETRVFDHITSTGMVSHVGPRGLAPYVRNVRRKVKTGGRYLHHALMRCYDPMPLDLQVGIAFNKKYVWPGFHWFTVGDHVKALEKNGFQIERMTSLTKHYAKTTAAWYERMMANRDLMIRNLGEPTFRAWQIFLAGITGAYLERKVHVYRIYCVAV